MSSLQNALRGAGIQSDARVESKADDGLYQTEWVRLLSRLTAVPKGKGAAHLENLLHKTVKDLKKKDKRSSRQLADLHGAWRKKVDKAAWAAVKLRCAELDLSDKAYRSIKQSFQDPHKLVTKLQTRRAEEYRGSSPKRLMEWLR